LDIVRHTEFDHRQRTEGLDWPGEAETMVGLKRLDNLEVCITDVLRQGVPGDLIETGVWRGGASIFMRGIRGYTKNSLACRLLSGSSEAQSGKIPCRCRRPVLEECRSCHSTSDALTHLYPKLSPGGYAIIDDYAIPGCQAAVQDYRSKHLIKEPLFPIDQYAKFWQRLAWDAGGPHRKGEEERSIFARSPKPDGDNTTHSKRHATLLALPYYLLVCPISQPGRTARFLRHIFEYQHTEKIYSRNQHLIPTVDPEQLFPGLIHQNISVLDLGSQPSGTTAGKPRFLASLLKLLGARAIFEFGTSEGRTTLQFAINSP
jgi:O-methyltransferase